MHNTISSSYQSIYLIKVNVKNNDDDDDDDDDNNNNNNKHKTCNNKAAMLGESKGNSGLCCHEPL